MKHIRLDLTKYLISEVRQSHKERVGTLRGYYPACKASDWTLARAGQRVQIIKGWVDRDGQTHQAIYDIAGGDNGASVDPRTCAVSGPGHSQLCATWRDPGFDPDQSAVYYVRVLENPSCRWTQQQCIAAVPAINCAGTVPDEYAACCDPEIPKKIQERSWASPIWYNVPPPSGC